MIKKIVFFLAILVSVNLFGQKINLDKYQYIVVADKFDYLKKADQHQTSSLTKFLLKKKGYKVFLSNETLPEEIVSNRCLSLFASVKDESSMLSVKSVIEIKDCYGKVVYTSGVGRSKYKAYKKAYQEAIREAYNTMEDFECSYNPNLLVQEKVEDKIVVPVKKVPIVVVTPVIKNVIPKVEHKAPEGLPVLYAQPINNGFQLVNLKPEVIFIILKTNVKDVFVVKDKNGVLYKKGVNWVAEFYENNQLEQKEYKVKF